MTKIEVEIGRVKAAMIRRDQILVAMHQEWREQRAPCCPGCMFGERWRTAAEKAERTKAWLVILLRKKGGEESEQLAHAVEIDAWP